MNYVKANNLNVEIPVYEVSGRSAKLQLLNRFSTGRIQSGSNGITVIQALKSLSFEAHDGDRIGLIGSNGSGKSTLLRVLAGIYEPTSGNLDISGKAIALLEMGLGMDDTMTGLQNIRLRGMLLGMTPQELDEKTAEIADFTDLDDYLHLPIRTYSSGMRLRLAFAISTAVDAQILLLDEIIGVGDAAFLDKANKRLKDLQNKANIVFLASHSNGLIAEMCNKVMWLDNGVMKFFGDAQQGLKYYAEQ